MVGALAGAGTLAALGFDIASLDLDFLVVLFGAGAAVLAEDDKGVVGSTLRGIGNVATPVINATVTTAPKVAEYAEEKELGLYAQAITEIGVEAAVRQQGDRRTMRGRSLGPRRRRRDAAASAAAAAAAASLFELPDRLSRMAVGADVEERRLNQPERRRRLLACKRSPTTRSTAPLQAF